MTTLKVKDDDNDDVTSFEPGDATVEDVNGLFRERNSPSSCSRISRS